MKKNSNFCNNCGKNGHVFPHCKYPITSLGIMAIRKVKNGLEYLMVRRKDSLGFVDFMRGRYDIHDVGYIQNIINEMTLSEKQRVITEDFDILWKSLWGNNPGIQYRMEERDSMLKFNKLKNGIIIDNQLYSLRTLVFDSTTRWYEQEWGFAKGRRNYKESDVTCALREFEEETGYDRRDVSLIQNLTALDEIFTGSNYKSYKHSYFIGFINEDILPKKGFQKSEVSKIEWKPYEEVIKCIRLYNVERISAVKLSKKILDTYNICC
tara:strand:+ start:636 stop:1433 length:798 start_codon:yes stop_codon:yes gene_type:complete